MNQDKLEKYIQENRTAFDKRIPPADTWRRIEQNIHVNGPSRSRLRYWQAAAVFFFAISIGLLVRNYSPSDAEVVVEEMTEFSQTEKYYLRIIEDKESILTAYLANYPDLAADFSADLEDLHQNYEKLKDEFDKTGSLDVLSALIRNLQLQQDLLNNQLEIIKQIENSNEDIAI